MTKSKLDVIDNTLYWDGIPVAEFLNSYPSETAKAKAGLVEMQDKLDELEKCYDRDI